MRNVSRRALFIAAALGAVTSAFGAGQQAYGAKSGAVFVMTNNATKNEVISYQRTADGQLFDADRYDTGGRGSGGAVDPLQSQGSLTLSRDHTLLFAANAGSGTVSVFSVEGASLRLIARAPSNGSEPLSIAQNGRFVYVLNGAAAGAVIVLCWDGRELRPVPNSTRLLSAPSAGGSSVTVSPDNKSLVVTERLTNNIDTFAIQPDGTLGRIVVNGGNPPGVFAASFAPNGAVIVSETGPAGVANASTISSFSVLANGKLSPISPSVPTLGAANCWNAIAPNGKWVYVSNAMSSTVSGFAIGANGSLTPIAGTVLGTYPAGSTNIDLAVTSDNSYLYTLNSGAGAIGVFGIQHDGSLVGLGQVEGLPPASGFNGIAAY